MIISSNPTYDIWRDLSQGKGLPDIDLGISAKEGRRKLVTHLQIERAPGLAKKKTAQFRKQHSGKLFCECCRHDYEEYGKHHDAMFEVHHRRALANSKKSVVTTLGDLAVVCSNCHRVIHRHNPMISVNQLAKRF
jgi:5-methylcytosine-specific restriction protein A